MEKYKVWLDADTGIDDAIAIVTALKLPNIEIVGASAVTGNMPVSVTYPNTRNVLSLCGREDIRVYKGAESPMIRGYSSGDFFHGKNGIGGAVIPDSKAPWEEKSAYDAIYEKAKELEGEMVIVAIGPLTNLAITIADHPDIIRHVRKIVIMGGAVEGGNASACAEFNIHCDPEAAETVFKSGIEIVMCGLDVTRKARLTESNMEEIHSYGNPAADLLYDSTLRVKEFNIRGGERGILMHDSCPFFYLAYPELFESYPCGIYVETQGSVTLGKTVCDLYSDHKWEDRHCTVVMDVDRDRMVEITKEIYRSYSE